MFIPAKSPGSNLKAQAFQLIVKWQSGCGESHTEELEEFMSRPGCVHSFPKEAGRT